MTLATRYALEEPVRFSRLKLIDESPLHYLAGPCGGDTDPLRKGSALHSALLGDPERVVVYDGGARNKRHHAYREFLEQHPGKLVLSPPEREQVDGMRRAIGEHPRARALLAGIQERTIDWTVAGRACRGTPDVVHVHGRHDVARLLAGRALDAPIVEGSKVLVELKSAVSSKPGRFRRQVRKLRYHGQTAWYREGLLRSVGAYPDGPVSAVYVVAVESKPPHPVTVFRVVPASLERGWRACVGWLELLRVCEQSGHFPGYAEDDVDLDVTEDDSELDWTGFAA